MTKKRAASKFWDNKAVWVILAVLSSIILWVYVTMTEGDLIDKPFNGVQVVFSGEESLRDKEGLIITDVSVTTVSVTLTGTRRELAGINAEDITAVITPATSEGKYPALPTITFAAGVSVSTISDKTSSPSSITYTVVKEKQRTIKLVGEFKGSIAEGFARQAFIFDPETIIISGPESEIKNVDRALVVVERDDVDRTLNFDSTYILVDADGNEVDTVKTRFSHETVDVTMPISAIKEVPLTVDIVDGAGATSANIKITCEPATITIQGDAEILSGINKIVLDTIDLASFGLTLEETFSIVLDNGVTNVTGVTEAKVKIQVIGLETKKFTVTNIEVINVGAGLTAEIITESKEVTIRGPAEVLAQIKANNIRIVADVAELGTTTGEFEPLARVYVDGFTGVGAVGEYKIFVKIG